MISRAKRLLALAVLSGLGWTVAAQAQGPAPAAGGKMYTNKQQFRLPFNLGEDDRQKLREVRLYVKGPGESWVCKETTPPTQSYFSFRAREDGEYQFNIVTVDRTGRATPADVAQEAPALIVVVDTVPPEVTVQVPTPQERAAGIDLVRVTVKDGNADPEQIRAEYQASDKTWKALPPGRKPDQFRCPANLDWTGLVRVTSVDRAGNTTVREAEASVATETVANRTPIEPTEVEVNPPRPTLPALPPVPSPVPSPAMSQFPTPEVVQTTTSLRPPAPPVTPSVAPPVLTPTSVASDLVQPNSPSASANRSVVSGPIAQLEYRVEQVGASGVGKVEVWITSDEGKNWQKLCEDPDHTSPAEVRLPGEGVYGLSVVVTNGNGVGDPPPARGTVPDSWVEIDSTRPSAQLLSVRQGQGEDAAFLLINWAASDKNFGPTPVDLYYAAQREGPWQPIVRGVKNDGYYRWTVPPQAGSEFFVRLDVTDRAGNTTRCESPHPVVVDLTRPRARVLGVTGSLSSPSGNTPTGN